MNPLGCGHPMQNYVKHTIPKVSRPLRYEDRVIDRNRIDICFIFNN